LENGYEKRTWVYYYLYSFIFVWWKLTKYTTLF
jgi:hypothetical protein